MDFEQRLYMAKEMSKVMLAMLEKNRPAWMKEAVYQQVVTLYQLLDGDLEKCQQPHEIYELLKNTLSHVTVAEAPLKEIIRTSGARLIIDWRSLDWFCTLEPVPVYRKHWGRVMYDIFYGEFPE